MTTFKKLSLIYNHKEVRYVEIDVTESSGSASSAANMVERLRTSSQFPFHHVNVHNVLSLSPQFLSIHPLSVLASSFSHCPYPAVGV